MEISFFPGVYVGMFVGDRGCMSVSVCVSMRVCVHTHKLDVFLRKEPDFLA